MANEATKKAAADAIAVNNTKLALSAKSTLPPATIPVPVVAPLQPAVVAQ